MCVRVPVCNAFVYVCVLIYVSIVTLLVDFVSRCAVIVQLVPPPPTRPRSRSSSLAAAPATCGRSPTAAGSPSVLCFLVPIDTSLNFDRQTDFDFPTFASNCTARQRARALAARRSSSSSKSGSSPFRSSSSARARASVGVSVGSCAAAVTRMFAVVEKHIVFFFTHASRFCICCHSSAFSSLFLVRTMFFSSSFLLLGFDAGFSAGFHF